MKSLKYAINNLSLKVDDTSTPAGFADLFKNKFFSVLRETGDIPSKLEPEDAPMNKYVYAYDLALVAPTNRALNKLLDICQNFASEHYIIYIVL